ncbi:putative bifunctional diguanylate cyclase/phosphodiesterase [Ammonifex thiophilus]|uniref:EAL domain-containing protein n=1 Tax=Ammonifex thiophilus TaxID=444093 RepID=A0A3D8P311_9THEO|nr:EAL domain-containing protein [Ammonifex thiophilus]RDV82976.1 EAL domain-containing protein [Ammonifex thiophilus]
MAYYIERVEISVRKVLLTTIAVVILGGVFLLLYFGRYTWQNQEDFRREVAREIDSKGLNGVYLLQNTLGLYRGLLNTIASELATRDQEKAEESVAHWARSFTSVLRLYYVQAEDGRILGSPYPWGQDGRQEPWYTEAVHKRGLVVLPPVRDPATGDYYIFFATPVYRESQLLGVVAVAVPSSNFRQFLAGQRASWGEQLGVLDSHGYVVAWTGEKRELVGWQLLEEPLFAPEVLTFPYHSGSVLEMHLFEIPGWNWWVIVAIDPAKVRAKEREVVLASLAVGASAWLLLALFSFSVFALYFFWQRKQLYFLAAHDFLTGLPNRYSLETALQDFLKKTASHARRGMLLFLDLDQFKLINDTLGHAAGDRALRAVVERMKRVLRKGDFLARLGGDEFAVLLEEADLAEAEDRATRLREAVCSSPLMVEGRAFPLGLSVGITQITEGDTPLQVLARADEALYLAKAEGGNRTVYLPPEEKREELREGGDWLSRLQDALAHGHFVLLYQPIVDLRTGMLCSCEALLRLKTRDGRLLLPHQFIPYAERYGLLPRLDRYVVTRAVDYLVANPQSRVFVNLSSFTIGDKDFIAFVKRQLEEKRVAPSRLGFEISERSVVRNVHQVKEWLKELKRIGCFLAIDDFGAGHSSFSWLVELLDEGMLDVIKIAGIFVKDLDKQPAMRALVEAIVALARAARKETVAEWVEREEVLAILKDLGVDCAQGYFFSPPLFRCSPESIAEKLERNKACK